MVQIFFFFRSIYYKVNEGFHIFKNTGATTLKETHFLF